jgi:hypothetical protein
MAMIVNMIEKVNKQSRAISQNPNSNSNKSDHFDSAPSPPLI